MASQRRLSYANIASTLALLIALSSGAYAVSTIGPGDIQPRAVRSKHINAKAIKGRHIKPKYLAGNRILSNTVEATQETSENRPIFRDPRTGLAVRVGAFARLRLVNTNQVETLVVRGVGWFGSTVYTVNKTLAPGAQDDVVFDATGFAYANLLIQPRRASPGAPTLQLTCMLHYSDPLPAMSCVGVG